MPLEPVSRIEVRHRLGVHAYHWPRAMRRAGVGIALLVFGVPVDLGSQPESLPIIRRTEFGVPHILARNFREAGVGLGYAQVEDYGERVVRSLLNAKGWMGRTFGADSMQSDFAARLDLARVAETYHLLDADTRAVYEGFAEGVNRYIRTHPERLPAWAQPVFNAHDVAATDIGASGVASAERLLRKRLGLDTLGGRTGSGRTLDEADVPYSEDGSNAWAFAPSRTKSGRAMLLRNPHLSWSAGYWEAHITVPGQLDFYGDFRIGSPFAVIAGFNKDLGWATTNNATDLDEVYALDMDPTRPDHYLFDGVSVPLRSQRSTVEYRSPAGLQSVTQESWTTALGPVVHRTPTTTYIVRAATHGEYRAGAQFLAMMRASSLAEWQTALAMRARATSNLTYADRAGNILTIWMASLPSLPHPSGGDTTFVRARTSADIWTHLVPLDSLPMTLNPVGGYVHNENDAPHFANLNAVLDPARYPANVERGELRLRSQLALQLIGGKDKLSLEDMIVLKHNPRMLLADRVKPDLLLAVQRSASAAELENAATLLRQWDNTASIDSRGSVLFDVWWRRYVAQARDSAYSEPWNRAQLTATPRGLGAPSLSVESLRWAVADVQRRHGALDVSWGTVHRVRRGTVDVPVAGCSGALGCFRVLAFEQLPDGTRVANSGDGWVLAVEFGDKAPRAFSILAYGESADSTSAHYADQAAMFARGEFKPVHFLQADVERHAMRTYRPGDR